MQFYGWAFLKIEFEVSWSYPADWKTEQVKRLIFSAQQKEGESCGGKEKAAEKNGGKESKFFPQMWFTSCSGKKTPSEMFYTRKQSHSYTQST